MDLGEDWSNNEIIQAAAIDEFTSLDGIEWRNGAETAADEVKFDDTLWKASLFIQLRGTTFSSFAIRCTS